MNHPLIKVLDWFVPIVIGLAYAAFLYWGNLKLWIAIAASVGFGAMFMLWFIARFLRDRASNRRMFTHLNLQRLRDVALARKKSELGIAAGCFIEFLDGDLQRARQTAALLIPFSSSRWHPVAVVVSTWLDYLQTSQVEFSPNESWFTIPLPVLREMQTSSLSPSELRELAENVRYPPVYQVWAAYLWQKKSLAPQDKAEAQAILKTNAANTVFTQNSE